MFDLKELYNEKKAEVEQPSQEKKPLNVIKLKKGALAPCIGHILNNSPEKTDRINFNKLVMILVSYAKDAGYREQEAWSTVKAFIDGYPYSDTYSTVEERRAHWESEWKYLNGNKDYKFKCSFILGLKLPGTAFDCKECPISDTEKDEISSDDVLDALNSNEDGDAELFICINRNFFCFDWTDNRWYMRTKKAHWKEDIVNETMRRIGSVIDTYLSEHQRQNIRMLQAEKKGKKEEAGRKEEIMKNIIKRIRLLQTKTRKTNILQLAATGTDSLGITGLEWDANPWLLGVKNGVINLKTGEREPVNPDLYIKMVAPVTFKGLNEPCPTWERFLDEIFNGDGEIVKFIQRLFGYALIGEVTEGVFPIFWGPDGRNGKDTLFETLHHVLGDYATPIETELLLSQRFNKGAGTATPEVLSLKGKRIIWASETEEGRRFDTAKVKFYTGGGTITARGLYAKRMLNFKPSFTVCLITNPKPRAKGDDPAFWERVVLIPLTQRFVSNPQHTNEHQVDIYMLDKLKEEAPGIMAWLVRGCLRWQEKGLNPPQTVIEATGDYKSEEDDIATFISGCCDLRDKAETKASVLYKAYKTWAEIETGEVMSLRKFGTNVKKRLDSYKSRSGVFYLGISLLENEDDRPL